MSSEEQGLTPEDVRRLLNHLRDPSRLVPPAPVLAMLAISTGDSPTAIGRATADFIVNAVERLKPADSASRHEQLPYLVLKTCFVDGVKMLQAADRLSLSRRQLTRECSRAVARLAAELDAASAPRAATVSSPGEPLPVIANFMPRPHVTTELRTALTAHRLLHVHGPKGVGKTSLIADLAATDARRRPVVWHRFRAGMNNTWSALSFELAEYLRTLHKPDLADYLSGNLGTTDPALVARLLVRDLHGSRTLFVFDDYHVAEEDTVIRNFLDEAAARLPEISIITVARHRPEVQLPNSFEVPPLTDSETEALLRQLGVRIQPEMAQLIRGWTQGVTHLVQLAASWMRTATMAEVSHGLSAFTQLDEVQDYLLDSVTELLDSQDRRILEAASIFRDRFTDALLAHVGQRTVGEVRDTRRRLVRYHVASRGRQGDVAFFHGTVRDYIYAHLDDDTRQALHGRAAEWFDDAGQPDEAAYHRRKMGADVIALPMAAEPFPAETRRSRKPRSTAGR